ncbi:sugar phosphate isomerase/epimerase family protein [Mucilaginibacter sp.]
MNRRRFLQSTGTVAAALSLPDFASAFGTAAKPHAIGLQLFTLFNVIDNDVTGNLKRVAAIGYKEIESAYSSKGPYYGYTPKSFAQMLKGMGLAWKSHHVIGQPFKLPPGTKMPAGADGKPMVMPKLMNLRDNMQQIVDDMAEGGVSYLVCAGGLPFETTDEIKQAVALLNKAGEACSKAGVQFCYHNHDQEFKTVQGQVPYTVFLEETDPKTVKMELDVAWSVKGGSDPVELFKKHPGRFPLWHVKNLKKDLTTIVPAGEGVVDYKLIFAQAATAGMKHFFVEHDMPADAYASITSSYKYLRSIKA